MIFDIFWMRFVCIRVHFNIFSLILYGFNNFYEFVCSFLYFEWFWLNLIVFWL